MNRCANCIRMLQLLKSRGFMTRVEIADALECNVRNIAEYRKELELAGYIIESTTGKFGGYRLMNDCLLPSVEFTNAEKRALQELREYIQSHGDFLMESEVHGAIDKMLSNIPLEEEHKGIYLDNAQVVISDQIRACITTIETAIEQTRAVKLSYRSIKDQRAKQIQIHPYEIIHYKGAYYCIAYSLKARDYRIYKFSEERMKQVQLLDQTFIRDHDFDSKAHIGKSGLIKDDVVEVELEIYEEAAILTAEKQIGLHPVHHWINATTLYYQTIFEGKQEAISFILSLGGKARVLSPASLQNEIVAQAEQMKERYAKLVQSM